MNLIGLKTIYKKEIDRMFRVPGQTLISPALTTALYFVVFGAAIGSNFSSIGGVTYAQFIVPGLIMMSLFTNSMLATSSGIYFPKFTGTIYELLSAPLSYLEITIGYVAASVTRAFIIGLIIYVIALLFTPIVVMHPLLAILFSLLTATTFALFGLILGIWAESFEKLNFFPIIIITPLSFLGGVFYSLEMLPPFWQTISLVNPIVYMISGLRWSFFGQAYFNPFVSLVTILIFLSITIGILTWIFKTGYRLKN